MSTFLTISSRMYDCPELPAKVLSVLPDSYSQKTFKYIPRPDSNRHYVEARLAPTQTVQDFADDLYALPGVDEATVRIMAEPAAIVY